MLHVFCLPPETPQEGFDGRSGRGNVGHGLTGLVAHVVCLAAKVPAAVAVPGLRRVGPAIYYVRLR